jgi:hypothetical protein
MSRSITLDLTASFVDVASPTSFGIYDASVPFQSDANGIVKQVNAKLGGNILDVELTNRDVYTCLEESALEYSAMINSYQAKSILADIMGSPTGSLEGKENKLARLSLALAKRKADAYSSEVLVGGTRTLFSCSLPLRAGVQSYDLKYMMSGSGALLPGERAEIREIFHFSPTAAYRFFDTSSAINYLHNQFSFESFTPETVFYLLPIWEDVLRAQQLELSHKIRRSNYSYSIINNVVQIYPVPSMATNLFLTYYKIGVNDDPFDSSQDPLVDGVTNLSNVPFGNIDYAHINSIGRQWIRRFALSLSKEVLGQVRSKVNSIPIPNGDLSLNGPQLISDSREEQMRLREELKELLHSMTYSELQKQETEQARALNEQISLVPLGIYVGLFYLFAILPSIGA